MEPQYSCRPPYHREDAGASERLVPAIVLIAVGAIFLLHNLHVVYAFELFRYWPAILIAVGIVKLVDSSENSGRAAGGVLVAMGGIFLAQSLGFLDVHFWDLWPLILIGIGLAMLFEGNLGWHAGVKTNTAASGVKEAAIFSGGKRVINDQNFRFAKYDAVFGGFEIDLRRANMMEDQAVLDLNAVFGGIEVKVPESWSVVVKGAGVFGAFQDSTLQPDPRIYPQPKRLIVKGGAVFGGVELKN
jgi:predicted membrane protein